MKPATTDEYIATFSDEQKAWLTKLRRIIKRELKDAEEVLKWGSPAFLDKSGMILVIFSGHKDHINLVVTPTTKEAFSDRLTDYVTGKGSVQLSYKKALPVQLIQDLVAYRLKEYKENGVKWK